MSPQRGDTTTRWGQEPHTVEEDNLWTMGSPMTTSRTGSRSASTATNTDIWQKSAERKRKNVKREHVSNARRKDISKDCKGKQTMKKRKIQEEESDEEDKNDKEQGFGKDLE